MILQQQELVVIGWNGFDLAFEVLGYGIAGFGRNVIDSRCLEPNFVQNQCFS